MNPSRKYGLWRRRLKIIATFGGFTYEGCGDGMKKSAAFF